MTPPADPGRAAPIIAWLLEAGGSDATDMAIVDELARRLVDAGVPVSRVWLASEVLDPTIDARALRWLPREGATRLQVRRAESAVNRRDIAESPFRHMLDRGETEFRARLEPPAPESAFPALRTFRAEGATDYLALAAPMAARARFSDVGTIVVSVTTDRPGGFGDSDLALLRAVWPAVALVSQMRGVVGTARTLLDTYLGADAARRVRAGNVERGRAEPIRAVVWFSDLVDYTRLADSMAHDATLALLNDYAGIVVDAIDAAGGDVLKFIGDGVLAIFRDADPAVACRRALAAWRACEAGIAALNVRRAADGAATTRLHLALHEGELIYGNFGGARRLDFTVLGAAVNEAGRMGALSRTLDQDVVLSDAFVAASGSPAAFVSLGRYALRGVGRPQELHTLDPTAAAPAPSAAAAAP
ncbi:MAG: adenylate/guanylate cyclase domain-containing protein [Rhodospirillales bacterium]|nr:MAG: adenylate/guanylate cyclase domain-containing protein [Rhodospirillales bacterium]